ncbi:hypothetical protein AB4Y45_33875 [Paraburkholderia sp. EG287A]|uniref:hypothetical protein n=1 Tax=Paraburkholderia sp. EG287A TaxID=3237012 RepID=UPI0034D17ABD
MDSEILRHAVRDSLPPGQPGPAQLGSAGQKKVNSLPYPTLRRWPALPDAIAVHTHLGTDTYDFRVPIKLLRESGFQPERGMHAALFDGRLILWNAKEPGPLRQNDEGQLLLSRRGLSYRITQDSYAIVQGPDYLIITYAADARNVAGAAPFIEHSPWARIVRSAVTVDERPLDLESEPVLAWKDFAITQTNPRRPSPIANVSGRLWWIAGFKAGDPVRFTRYPNATLVEIASPSEMHSVVCQVRERGVPRHYIGPSLFDVHQTDKIRVAAMQDRLVITLPESEFGKRCESVQPRLCSKQTCAHKPTAGQLVSLLNSQPKPQPAPLVALPPENVAVRNWKDYSADGRSCTVHSEVWRRAGFRPGDPVRIVRYANCVVVEQSTDEDCTRHLGSGATGRHVHATLGLVRLGLATADKLRAIATRDNRLVLTDSASDIAKRCLESRRIKPANATTRARKDVTNARNGITSEANRKSLARRAAQGGRIRLRENSPRVRLVERASLTLEQLGVQPESILMWREYEVSAKESSLIVKGDLWAAADIPRRSPVRVQRYNDGIVVEKTSLDAAERLLGAPSSPAAYHCFGLAKAGLAGHRRLLVIATPGRVLLTTPESPFGKLCLGLASEQAGDIPAMRKPLGDVEVGQYPVPAGRRLQVQGKWLAEHGFQPGARFGVSGDERGLAISLGEYGSAVTEHSPGRSKLYVPAAELAKLNCERVAIYARNGALRVVPAN